MVGHLLRHKAHLVGVLWGGRVGAFLLGGLCSPGYHPGAVERLADDRIVGLLGNGALAALVEGGKIILHKANHSVLWAAAVGDGHKEIWVRHEVGVHLQKGALLQDEGGEDHLEGER